MLKLDLLAEIEPVFERLKAYLDKQRAIDCFKDQVDALMQLMDSTNPIVQAQLYVNAHFNENLRMEDIAKRFFMSPAHFSRTFKQTAGMSFSDYIKELRLKWAYNMLKSTNLLIQDIAREAGYSDIKYFTQIFKERYGILPSAVR